MSIIYDVAFSDFPHNTSVQLLTNFGTSREEKGEEGEEEDENEEEEEFKRKRNVSHKLPCLRRLIRDNGSKLS